MENMDKGLTLPKWVLIVQPKIPQKPQNLFAQFVGPSPKVLDFNEKKASLGVRSPWIYPTTVLATFPAPNYRTTGSI